jgi:hypothetical protein
MAYETPIDVAHVSQVFGALPIGKLVVLLRNYREVSNRVVAEDGQQVADDVRLVRSLWPGSGIAFYHYPHLSNDQSIQLRREVFADSADDTSRAP